MKKIFVGMLLAVFALSSCKQDYAADWVGTYEGVGTSNTEDRVIITRVDDNTLKLELQRKNTINSTYFTYATVASGKLDDATTVIINEDGTVFGTNGTYHFAGTGTRSGSTITLVGTATQGTNVLNYYFTGARL